jgi:hypothetical protein
MPHVDQKQSWGQRLGWLTGELVGKMLTVPARELFLATTEFPVPRIRLQRRGIALLRLV